MSEQASMDIPFLSEKELMQLTVALQNLHPDLRADLFGHTDIQDLIENYQPTQLLQIIQTAMQKELIDSLYLRDFIQVTQKHNTSIGFITAFRDSGVYYFDLTHNAINRAKYDEITKLNVTLTVNPETHQPEIRNKRTLQSIPFRECIQWLRHKANKKG